MAGTIISTPNLGDSDWSGWVTQQERTDRGFMAVSLTNLTTSAASSIATGSVMECAGSIYQFTQTSITLATGTASASVAAFYHVIPSAGGTTCTIEMDSTTPTWIDAKQGYYASAASITRVIGGCFINSSGTYDGKWLYFNNREPRLFLREFEIGEWDMDGDENADVYGSTVTITVSNVVFAFAKIQNDAASVWYDLSAGGTFQIFPASELIRLYRIPTGFFDNANFNATASTLANRGILYVLVRE